MTHPTRRSSASRAAARRATSLEAYVVEVHRHLLRFMPHLPSRENRDDIIQDEALVATELADVLIERYPDPAVYVSVRLKGRRAIISWQRRQGAQQGTGSRFGRQVDSLHTRVSKHDSGTTLLDVIGSAPGAATTEKEFEIRATLEVALATLDARQRRVLFLIDVLGFTAGEAGDMLGHARETITRIRSEALRTARNACFATAA